MITVTVKIHGSFRRLLAPGMTGGDLRFTLEDGTSVAELIGETIGFPTETPRVVLVNGLHASPETRLADRDRIAVFSPVAGG